ncbi:phosphohistidine phosphatase SixA [Acaryochloris marina]|uniref:Phosphohistidine phosphatase SixA n=1 Tax=Acaryochloris marina (strain MBIC 11017) TaxID=329726 RepID=B0BZW0_ACAM1|nr:phosphohistidine phosphatase SixA [Acaryochloris marina]ABW27170.1 phosphohistidine phosphatase SixA [Acaryochloris marina MBIC11017]BDM81923.1 phosphohistidine phosphatase SixA [Acaryochloris marina MBIC10699]
MAPPLKLYLIRHGIAEERQPHLPDQQRALTAKGRQKTQKVAQRLQTLGIHFDDLQTSPLVRAHQTAEILQHQGLVPRIHVSDLLSPDGNWPDWLQWLQDWRNPGLTHLALVGHEPNLSTWAEILVWGQPRQQLVVKKAGMIGLLLPEHHNPVGQSTLFWLTAPKLLF